MTGLLLDTSVLIWYLEKHPRLTPSLQGEIEGASFVYISTVSAWEIAIKRSLGKLKTPDNLPSVMALNGFIELRPSLVHAAQTEWLPPIHKDPFDRMLIAQAICEGLTLVTADRNIPRYGVKVIAA